MIKSMAAKRCLMVQLIALAIFFLNFVSIKAQRSPDINWIRIFQGSFQMGCVPADEACLDDEIPRHEVRLSRPYALMSTEATVSQYVTFLQITGYAPPPPPSFPQDFDHPIVNVSWHEAAAFCDWVGGRLPT